MLSYNPQSQPRVIEAVLEGAAVAVLAVTATAFLLWVFLFGFFLPGGFYLLLLFTAAFGAVVAALLAMFGVVLNLPLALLVARRFNGPLPAAIVLGAGSGSLEGCFFGALGRSPLDAGDLPWVLFGGIAGATLAWRVWLKCVAPRRAAPRPPTV